MVYTMCAVCGWFFFFKQKTAYEMRISDWSSDVCSSDLAKSDGDASSYSRSQTCPDGSLLRTWRQMGHIQTEFRHCGKGRPSRRARDGADRPGLYGQRLSARRTAPQAGHGAFRRQQGSRTERPSHRGDGEGLRPVIVAVPLLRELRMQWSRHMPRNQRIITHDDIMDLGAFETIRAANRQESLLRKRFRRLSIGPHVSVHFENWDTMWWQVHEMLRIEKGGEEQLKAIGRAACRERVCQYV